jgi:hypothetical protein
MQQSQEILCLLWKLTVQIPRSQEPPPSLDPALSQVIPAHIFTPYFFNTYLNIITPSSSSSPKLSLSFRFQTKVLSAFLASPMRVTCHAHLVLLFLSPYQCLVKSTNYEEPHYFLHSSCYFSVLGPNIPRLIY